jgi:hypothetical protein
VKGLLKTFETVVGLSIVLISFVALYTNQEPLPEFDTVAWRTSGQNALQALDYSNQLRFDALNNNTVAIEARLESHLPANVDFQIQVCGLANCSALTINAERSTSAHYMISGDANNSTAREITLYMWSND